MEGNDGQSKEVVRAWRAWRTVHEMCADRGYELAESEIQISLDRFRHEYLAADGSVKELKTRKAVVRMDPDCAICHAPATMACDCEAKGLEVAIKQAENRMMQSIYSDIRSWVRGRAQDYILEYYRLLTDRRKTQHNMNLERITAHASYYYQQQPHPNDIAAAQGALKRGIDEDWQASVQRYPEVLEYFYSLVELNLPPDDDPADQDLNDNR
ncbi:hypothetical protein BN1708_003454 [Verticillium longisporum]|uniref:RNA polymerase Rpb5 N-terminal domain-containing protein n=1 Tax=Verticillium longisporum TaxID=100787 RepID=A0A0G4LIW3_VERLO|nr:hypothetical protein BN1708_003454 [Verticillium longisporum]